MGIERSVVRIIATYESIDMSKKEFRLCLNCLEESATKYPVGPDKGPQMDTYREALPLCARCQQCLSEGDLKTFAERYTEERLVTRNVAST